jgi:hypothetical protein
MKRPAASLSTTAFQMRCCDGVRSGGAAGRPSTAGAVMDWDAADARPRFEAITYLGRAGRAVGQSVVLKSRMSASTVSRSCLWLAGLLRWGASLAGPSSFLKPL